MSDQYQNLPPVHVPRVQPPLPEQQQPASRVTVKTPQPDFEPEKPVFSLRALLYVIFSHKYKILTCFVLGSLVLIKYVTGMKDAYVSEAKIMIIGGRDSMAYTPGFEEMLTPERRGNTTIAENMEISLLTNIGLISQVVDRIGADRILYPPNRPLPVLPDGRLVSEATREEILAQLSFGGKVRFKLADAIYRTRAALNLLPPKLSKREQAISVLTESLEVRPTMSRSGVLQVTCRSHSPGTAQDVLNEVLKTYKEFSLKRFQSEMNSEFLQQKAREKQRALDAKVAQLESKQRAAGIFGEETKLDALALRINTLEDGISAINVELKARQERLNWLNTAIENRKNGEFTSDSLQLAEDPYVLYLRQKIWDLTIEEKKLAATNAAGYRPLEEIRKQIKALNEELTRKPAVDTAAAGAVGDPVLLNYESQLNETKQELANFEARKQGSEEQIAAIHQQIETVKNYEKEVGPLKSEIATLQEGYRMFVTGMQTMEVSKLLDEKEISNSKVLHPATYPSGTTKNLRKLIALLGFGIFISLFAGIALAFALEYVNHTLKTPEAVEQYLGLPVLMIVPAGRGHKPERVVQ